MRACGDGRAREGHTEANRFTERELEGRSLLGAGEMISRSESSVERRASSPGFFPKAEATTGETPVTPPALGSFLFRGSEEDQDFKLFLNIVEPMLQLSLHENN